MKNTPFKIKKSLLRSLFAMVCIFTVTVFAMSCRWAIAGPAQKITTSLLQDYGQKYHVSAMSVTLQCPAKTGRTGLSDFAAGNSN